MDATVSDSAYDDTLKTLLENEDDPLIVHPKNVPSRLLTVEPACDVLAATVVPYLKIVTPQYIRDDIATNLNYSLENENVSDCTDRNESSNPDFATRQKIADLTAYWLMISSLLILLPALVIVPIGGPLSDRIGRRKFALILPCLGYCLWFLVQLIVVYNDLPLRMYVGSNLFAGLGGGYYLFQMGTLSYISDISNDRKTRLIRIIAVLVSVTVTENVSILTIGYIIEKYRTDACIGILWTILVLQTICVVYLVIFLDEPKKPTKFKIEYFKDILQGLFGLLKENTSRTSRRRVRILLLLATELFTWLAVRSTSTSDIYSIYGLGPPFCWSSIMLSYFNVVSAICFLLACVSTKLFSLCLQDFWILSVSYVFGIARGISSALAPNTGIFFLAQLLTCLQRMVSPTMDSMYADIVTTGEQGSIYAAKTSVMCIASLLSPLTWNPIYIATRNTEPTVVFYVIAGVHVICILFSTIWYVITKKELEVEPLSLPIDVDKERSFEMEK